MKLLGAIRTTFQEFSLGNNSHWASEGVLASSRPQKLYTTLVPSGAPSVHRWSMPAGASFPLVDATRCDGVSTIGVDKWSHCSNDPLVLLTVILSAEPIGLFDLGPYRSTDRLASGFHD